MQELMEYRVRSKVSQKEMDGKIGRILQDDDRPNENNAPKRGAALRLSSKGYSR